METNLLNEPYRELAPEIYPLLLGFSKYRPKRLFCKGALPSADKIGIAMVGTRRPTASAEELCRRELPHFIVSGSLYPVSNEQDCLLALADILSAPPAAPCSFDASKARCVLSVSAGEVHCS